MSLVIPKVIETIVKSELCIGCGICVYKCPNQALEMHWNDFGFLEPALTGNCDSNGDCLKVCPFNPSPEDEVKTENELSDEFLFETKKAHLKIGKYIGVYAGYSKEFRLTSSSGGIATYIFKELLETGFVNHIFSVIESKQNSGFYEYSIISSIEQLLNASKTKYFPVTLGTVMPKIHQLKGRVAIVGVACFIKAVRLSQHYEPELKKKIPFLVGIICGGIKSRFFTEYLASKAGVEISNIDKPQFRIKDLKSTAGDYSFGCVDKSDNIEHTIKMRQVGDMWGTGMFKNNACDFCDDVTTELADISLGDAWLQPYSFDGAGTNVIVTRSKFGDEIIQKGIKNNDLNVDLLTLERFIASQQGSFNHRHTGLSYRIKLAKRKNQVVPPKRFGNEKIIFDFQIVQHFRMQVRKRGLELWALNPNSTFFDLGMNRLRKKLKQVTRIYHYRRAIINKILNIID